MRKKYTGILAVLLSVTVLLNLLACLPAFCDWYRLNIYHRIAAGLARLTDLLSFPLGEILMYGALGMLVIAALLALRIPLADLWHLVRKPSRKKKLIGPFSLLYGKILLMTGAAVLLVYTLFWIIPLRASQITFEVAEDRVYTVEELEALRTFMVTHLNEAAEEVQRDQDGHVIYISGTELDAAVADAMNRLGEEEFPLLCGFYPGNKTALCSPVLDWMEIGGFTYPYTMELTTSRYVTGLYLPMLLAHEESHHMGYYLESEANYLAYRALSESSDLRLTYAAYENMYYYVNSAYVKSLRQTMTEEQLTEYYQTQTQRSDLVKSDEAAAQAEVDLDYQNSVSSVAEKTLAPAAEKAAEKGWQVQAQALGDACYDGVVEMLLKYYYK